MSDFLKEFAEQAAEKEFGGDEGQVVKDVLSGDTQGALSSAEGIFGMGKKTDDTDSNDSDESEDDTDSDDTPEDDESDN